jgi:hypothetical protein
MSGIIIAIALGGIICGAYAVLAIYIAALLVFGIIVGCAGLIGLVLAGQSGAAIATVLTVLYLMGLHR